MSLINDALKRASAAKPHAGPHAAAIPLQPIYEHPRTAGPLPLVLCIVGVGALLVSGAFWLKSHGTPPRMTIDAAQSPQVRSETPRNSAAAPSQVVAPSPQVAAAIEPAAVTASAPVPITPSVADRPLAVSNPSATLQTSPTQPEFVAREESPSVPASAQSVEAAVQRPRNVAAAKAAPELKLQAIYYRMKGPTVVINGKTLRTGDTIAGAKLISIQRTFALIEAGGEQRKLTIR